MQNDRAKFKNVVRGFSLVLHDPSRVALQKEGVPRNDVRASVIAASCCHCERSEAISEKQRAKMKERPAVSNQQPVVS